MAVSDENVLENSACSTEGKQSSLTIKTVKERENFMMQQREKILQKNTRTKIKRNVVVSELRKSGSKKKKEKALMNLMIRNHVKENVLKAQLQKL